MKKLFCISCGFVLLLFFFGSADAAYIQYIYKGNASGSLGNNPFSNADFTLSALADTDDIIAFHYTSPRIETHGYYVDNISVSIDIDGIGIYEFLSATRSWVNNTIENAGIVDQGPSLETYDDSEILRSPDSPAWATWDMQTPLNLITGNGWIHTVFATVETNGGILDIDISDGSIASFKAQITPVPVPTSISLLAIGLMGMFGILRKKGHN